MYQFRNKDMGILQILKTEYSWPLEGLRQELAHLCSCSRSNGLSYPFLSCHICLMLLFFLFWKQEPNELTQTCLASYHFKSLTSKFSEERIGSIYLEVYLAMDELMPQGPMSGEQGGAGLCDNTLGGRYGAARND